MGGRSKRRSKTHSEESRDIQQLYLSPEQLATGLGARWYGERTGSGSPVQRKNSYARYVTRWIAV